jgi:S1-C subfamily serine protease
MDFTKVINEVKSGVVHLLFQDTFGKKISSGSAFLSNGKLITCDHVVTQPFPQNTSVHIRFEDSSKIDFSEDIVLSIAELRTRIKLRSPEDQNDYCLLDVPEINYADRYNFEIANPETDAQVGIEILFMGYPFDHYNLVSHRGYISSLFKKNDFYTFQLDASVNASNSGGPLVHPYTKKVLGIITRKETSLRQDFEKLINVLDQNVQILSQPTGTTAIMAGINIKEAILATQIQMRVVVENMKRSSNAGIGFAFDLAALISNPGISV